MTRNFFSALTLLLISFLSAHSATIYVTQNGAGSMDGSSWADAANGQNLQNIIDNASVGDEIWVACGTYTPTTGTDRSISISLRSGVTLFGGFQGTENLLTDRDLTCGSCTLLSGEIGAAGDSDNSYTVVWAESVDSTALLDGFWISGGNDDRTPTSAGNGLGGGLYNHGYGVTGFAHPTIRNCIFSGNQASWGGGAFNNGYDQGNAEPTYINCIFYDNYAYIEAGGMDSYGVGGNASPTVINTLFYENASATNVGAMYAWGGNAGGNCHPVLINCVFANNTATNGYGGAFIADAQDENGGTSSGSCTVTLQNCIIWNNSASSGVGPQFYVRGSGAQVIATYSDIDMTGQNGPHVISGPGTGNINMDPQFQDILNGIGTDNCWLTQDDGLMPTVFSPCVDAGDPAGVYATDILGLSRITAGTVDMGAYEVLLNNGIEDGQAENSILAFPNPAKNWVTIRSRETLPSPLPKIKISNLMGQQMEAEQEIHPSEIRIHLGSLPAGVYQVQFGEKVIPLIKQ